MSEPSASSTLQLPRSTRKLELKGLARMLAATLPARLVVAGGPQAGKTTLVSHLARANPDAKVRGSDELIGLGWSESSEAASHWFDEPGSWICEGAAMPRALRKWLARNPEGAPADLIVWVNEPVVARSRGQHVMALGCQTVWNEIRTELTERGQRVLEF